MLRLKQFLGRALLVIVIVAGILWLLAPQDTVDQKIAFQPKELPEQLSELPSWLASKEALFSDLRPGDSKRIIWAGQPGMKTALSVVYVHGFSAGPEEIRPVPDMIAKAIGANLFFTRLTGHGRSGDALATATAGEWLEDMAEAMAIGRMLGERVLIVSTSTGGTLAAVAATDPQLTQNMAGIIMISPNLGLRPLLAKLLELPFARIWGPWLVGKSRAITPHNAQHAAHWTLQYPTVALFPMAALVRLARKLDYSEVKIPLLVLLSPEDLMVNPAHTYTTLESWVGPKKIIEWYVNSGDDPYSHVITGDVLSPSQTSAITSIISDWIKETLT